METLSQDLEAGLGSGEHGAKNMSTTNWEVSSEMGTGAGVAPYANLDDCFPSRSFGRGATRIICLTKRTIAYVVAYSQTLTALDKEWRGIVLGNCFMFHDVRFCF